MRPASCGALLKAPSRYLRYPDRGVQGGDRLAVPYEKLVRLYRQWAGQALGDMRCFEVFDVLKMSAVMLGLERAGNWNSKARGSA